LQLGYAGALGALPMTLIVAPAEQVKIQLQTSNVSLLQAFKSLFSGRENLRTLKNGIFLTGFRDVPAGFLYFSTYEGIKQVWSPDVYGPVVVPLAGGISLHLRMLQEED
jgi:solute carrier family 25 carnitine/acylcarnitine transporter 20/29